MAKKTQEIITIAIVTLLIVTLLGGFIISYLTSSSPILYSDTRCDSYLSGPESDYDFGLRNMAENTALATICFNVDNAFFKNNDDLVHDYCYGESKISPKSSDLTHHFTPRLILSGSDLKDGDNMTINIFAKCNQKIWSFASRPCEGLSYKCIYKKRYDAYNLINQ